MIKTNKKKISYVSIVLWAILVIYTLVFLALVLWGVLTSLKTNDDITLWENYFGLPKHWDTREVLKPWEWEWKNYGAIVEYFQLPLTRNGRRITVPFYTQVAYSVIYTTGCALFSTLCPCLVAYATSKFRYAFNKVIDVVVLITMIVPIVGSAMSMVSTLHALHIYDTFFGIFVQKFYFAGMYYLVFAAVFKGVSKEYYDAAHLDGASEFAVMTRIAFPLVLSSFALAFLLHFMQFWNDYQTLLLYAPSHPSIAYGLFRVMTDATGATALGSIPVRMAGCVIVAVPLIIVFLIFRNKLMGNFTIGGVKE